MSPFTTAPAALEALRTFATSPPASMPADTATALAAVAMQASPVSAIGESIELLYARVADLDDDGKALLAELTAIATKHGWHELHSDERGVKIELAARRERGETFEKGARKPQAKKDDPAAIERMRRPRTAPANAKDH